MFLAKWVYFEIRDNLIMFIGQTYAIPTLINVLSKKDEDKMVRHEAAEALGAIGDKVVLPVLKEYLNDEEEVVRETCELAIDKICNPVSNEVRSAYTSVDPAPALSETEHDLSALKDIYLDPSKSLFERYRAMFTLRNIGTKESIEILCMGFNDKSALFRHEVAFVFGQMQREESVPALIEVLQRPGEVAMVRHEAAEALGSIATEECKAILADYAKDNEQVVKESCLVALDMLAYENSQEFHYSV